MDGLGLLQALAVEQLCGFGAACASYSNCLSRDRALLSFGDMMMPDKSCYYKYHYPLYLFIYLKFPFSTIHYGSLGSECPG
ncbi:hypothetical protein HAX54_051798 [Datura stramonium]|uniref:Uncharacterized protein n=1 Tax=Datura stramonium TaxID=4076 RepID=A0ABS8RRD2_DATST|nr:hypothetical protein [Datura stramonium]